MTLQTGCHFTGFSTRATILRFRLFYFATRSFLCRWSSPAFSRHMPPSSTPLSLHERPPAQPLSRLHAVLAPSACALCCFLGRASLTPVWRAVHHGCARPPTESAATELRVHSRATAALNAEQPFFAVKGGHGCKLLGWLSACCGPIERKEEENAKQKHAVMDVARFHA